MQLLDFNEISMNGRMAYLFQCIEKYLSVKYPAKDWTPLSRVMWNATSDYWDEWDFRYIEIIPEFLFDAASYEASEFEYLSKEEYTLFSTLLKDLPSEVNTLLLLPHKLQEIYCYSSIPGTGEEATKLVLSACKILEASNIELPNISAVKFSHFSEKNGWGNSFDGHKLSLLLN